MGEAARQAGPWVKVLGRAGYTAKAVQYATIGGLAALAAFDGTPHETKDSKGALREIATGPFGRVLLFAMAIGLAGYTLYCFAQALLDPGHEAGAGAKGIAKRIGRFGTGLLHAGLVVYAIGLLTGVALGGHGEGKSARGWTAQLLAHEGGAWVVGGAGVGIAVFALFQIYKAWKADLDHLLCLDDLGSRARRGVVQVSRFGIAARGVVFALVGGFLVIAAVEANPNEARGLGEALASLLAVTAGRVLLGAVALGLVAFGVYELLRARYNRFATG
jgi:hypothetical protein